MLPVPPVSAAPRGQPLAPGILNCLGSGRLEDGILRFQFSTYQAGEG